MHRTQSLNRKYLAVFVQVLDDNKKLCLMSGEIIQMTAQMNLIFEVQDLAAASPATVSRCGMVYVEPSAMGWRHLMKSWLIALPECMQGRYRDQMAKLFEWLLPPCLRCVQKNCKLVMPMQVLLPNCKSSISITGTFKNIWIFNMETLNRFIK